jgi:hypothetical protein
MLTRSRILLAVLVSLIAAIAGGSPAALAHRDPCHLSHACPSDHHTYAWNGLSCTSYPDERLASDTITEVVEGRTYWCHRESGASAGSSGSTSGSSGSIPPGIEPGPILPDRRLTPGVALAGVTAAQVCETGWASAHRNVPTSEKDEAYARYGIRRVPYAYEVDHLVSLELGGSNDIRNLWPEKERGQWGAMTKDRLENRLHELVCGGQLSLASAQHDEATDWIAAYRRYVG